VVSFIGFVAISAEGNGGSIATCSHSANSIEGFLVDPDLCGYAASRHYCSVLIGRSVTEFVGQLSIAAELEMLDLRWWNVLSLGWCKNESGE
jgi:hypothetical protein